MRRCEVFTEGREWREIARADLRPGMVFRLFEPDGAPVVTEDEETGERVDRWRVTGAPRVVDGEWEIDTEPIPESGVERAVREGGVYWPSGANPVDAGWVPRRLR